MQQFRPIQIYQLPIFWRFLSFRDKEKCVNQFIYFILLEARQKPNKNKYIKGQKPNKNKYIKGH